MFGIKQCLFVCNSRSPEVLEETLCCLRGVTTADWTSWWCSSNSGERGVWGKGGLMKYLRFRLNRNSEKLPNKRGRPRAPIVPGTWRKQGPGGYRCEASPYWVRTCRLCSQLCCRTPTPATSPLPLSAFVRADFTPSWLHGNGFVSATRRPCPSLTINDRSRCITGSHIHLDPIRPCFLVAFYYLWMTRWWILFLPADVSWLKEWKV